MDGSQLWCCNFLTFLVVGSRVIRMIAINEGSFTSSLHHNEEFCCSEGLASLTAC